MTWYVDFSDDDEKEMHVIPLGDMCRHEVSQECWCQPEQDEDVDTIWVHNSMDEREKFERGERKVS